MIIGKEDFENELRKYRELIAELESKDRELKLKSLKLQEKRIRDSKTEMEEPKETYKFRKSDTKAPIRC